MRSEPAVLDETDIDFYGEPNVRFHINTGRTFESKTIYEFDEDGNKTVKETMNTIPCPTVDVYDVGDNLEVVVHLPTANPIIIDWFTVENEYDAFLRDFVNGLEEGYMGIDEVTRFEVKFMSEKLGNMVQKAIEDNTPISVDSPLNQNA